jgi:hypothetical protein
MNPLRNVGAARGSDYDSAETKPFGAPGSVDWAHGIQAGIAGLIDKC